MEKEKRDFRSVVAFGGHIIDLSEVIYYNRQKVVHTGLKYVIQLNFVFKNGYELQIEYREDSTEYIAAAEIVIYKYFGMPSPGVTELKSNE